jgi:CheY-like chemotaxis protein
LMACILVADDSRDFAEMLRAALEGLATRL